MKLYPCPIARHLGLKLKHPAILSFTNLSYSYRMKHQVLIVHLQIQHRQEVKHQPIEVKKDEEEDKR